MSLRYLIGHVIFIKINYNINVTLTFSHVFTTEHVSNMLLLAWYVYNGIFVSHFHRLLQDVLESNV